MPKRIRNVGSIKFDPANLPPSPLQPSEVLKNFGIDPTRPILLGGSTHPGEEEILGRVFLELRRDFPDLFLYRAASRGKDERDRVSVSATRFATERSKRNQACRRVV